MLAAFATAIRLRSLPNSLPFSDICQSIGYLLRRRESPLWLCVKDFEKKKFKILGSMWEKRPNKNQSFFY